MIFPQSRKEWPLSALDYHATNGDAQALAELRRRLVQPAQEAQNPQSGQ